MNRRIKKQWVKALKSGKYKQGEGQLRDEHNRFCCLGVLCNLYAKEHPKIAAKQKEPQQFLGEDSFLPRPVSNWAGFKGDSNPAVIYRNREITLSHLNDGIGHVSLTFDKLAKIIEEQL